MTGSFHRVTLFNSNQAMGKSVDWGFKAVRPREAFHKFLLSLFFRCCLQPTVRHEMFLFWRTSAPAPSENSHEPLQKLISSVSDMCLSDSVTVGQVKGLGGYADVYYGTLKLKRTNKDIKVAIKKFRILSGDMEKFVKVHTCVPSKYKKLCVLNCWIGF